MNERQKYAEAVHFANRMRDPAIDHAAFRYELSAFLSATRSLMQFALSDAQRVPGGRRWYESWVQKEPLIRFFRDQRDDNVHRAPVQVPRVFKVVVSEFLVVDEELELPHSHVTTDVTFRFSNWEGSESAIELIQRYLNILNELIIDGVQGGWLTE